MTIDAEELETRMIWWRLGLDRSRATCIDRVLLLLASTREFGTRNQWVYNNLSKRRPGKHLVSMLDSERQKRHSGRDRSRSHLLRSRAWFQFQLSLALLSFLFQLFRILSLPGPPAPVARIAFFHSTEIFIMTVATHLKGFARHQSSG